TYPHPSLQPVLERTLGIPLFQEQLLRMAMIAAGFSGGEAEELRRAMGYKRSEKRMQEVEKKLRRGMGKKGISGKAQEEIVRSITSFALYGFPESHAASFALLAYASAYLKCHYLAAFTAAMLNNQPMGFYSPATLIKDAQRHGLRVKPVDVLRSGWLCTLERESKSWAVRLGMRYVKGLREEIGKAIAAERARSPFTSIDDLAQRIPVMRKPELRMLAQVGALNWTGREAGNPREYSRAPYHRRDALWQAERALRPAGPLLEKLEEPLPGSPLAPMTPEERTVADFQSAGITVGRHPMAYHRERLRARGVRTAVDLRRMANGMQVTIAGAVICRQRPATANGFLFLSLEDETGIANTIVTPDLFRSEHAVLVREPFLLIQGKLQNQDQVISVKAESVLSLALTHAPSISHDFR
ncbi:MAG: error-prone DNA polymerase, partial [Terriglobia bacterium]